MNAETITRIDAFLDAHHVMSLATCGHNGPHAANLFYVRDGLALLWASDPQSRHSANLADNASVAATVAPDCCDIEEIRGVQISGHAHAIAGDAQRAYARRLLEKRYPPLKRLLESAAALRDLSMRMAFYRLEPACMVLIDNSRGFGHKETLELETLPADLLREPLNTTASSSQADRRKLRMPPSIRSD
jgi:uncharacterized protein YhbP (UPF0306 family)